MESFHSEKVVPAIRFVNNIKLRVVHRHLNILRTEAFLKDVDQFVANNMGKKYDFSLKDYLFNRTSTGEGERDVFFCSSLVAKLYKKLQLL